MNNNKKKKMCWKTHLQLVDPLRSKRMVPVSINSQQMDHAITSTVYENVPVSKDIFFRENTEK